MPEKRYISIVDDHRLFRKGLSSLIDLIPGYQVLSDTGNGKEFITSLDQQRLPDIALVDIAMPEMNGYETACWIRQHHPEIKILALSTMDSETAIIRMIRSGARGYVLKDSDPKELKTAFDDLFSLGYYYNEIVTRKLLHSINQLMEGQDDVKTLMKITDREIEFLRLACSERSYKQIAQEMYLSERTIDGYRDALFGKLSITSRVGLVIFAIKNKIVEV